MSTTKSPIQLPPPRAGREPPQDLQTVRAMIHMAPNKFPDVAGLKVENVHLGGVRCKRVSLEGAPTLRVLHMHGGGYRLGAPELSVGFASHLAANTGAQIIAPAYRLAPEHPFPAGLSDALSVLEALTPEEQSRLVISGDSAGGGLAASLTQLALSRGIRPLGLVLFAPWLDLTLVSDSYAENAASDTLFSPASAQVASELYLQGHSPTDPLASALFAEVSDYPPTLIIVGEHEVLRDDSVKFAAALQAAGRDVTLIRTPQMEHVAPTRDPALLGSTDALAAVVGFLKRVAG